MQNFDSNIHPDYSRNKIIVISIGFALQILNGVVSAFSDEQSSAALIVFYVAGFALNFLAFAWCYYDSAERGESLSVGWRFAIIIIGLFGLIIYLFSTRGFKRGLIAFGWLLLIFIGTIMCASGAAIIVYVIDGVR